MMVEDDLLDEKDWKDIVRYIIILAVVVGIPYMLGYTMGSPGSMVDKLLVHGTVIFTVGLAWLLLSYGPAIRM